MWWNLINCKHGWNTLSNPILQALSTAVWSVLKAKSQMLKCPNGFIAKFYAVSETVSPVFAWGFLGTDEKLKTICLKFKVLQLLFYIIYFTYNLIEIMQSPIITILSFLYFRPKLFRFFKSSSVLSEFDTRQSIRWRTIFYNLHKRECKTFQII